MDGMADPTPAMDPFEAALGDGDIDVQRSALDRELFAYSDMVMKKRRWAWARIERAVVMAFVHAAPCDPVEGLPCFQFGCVVPKRFQGQGLTTGAPKAAIAEMRHSFGQEGSKAFYVEAVVHVDNSAYRRVADKVFGGKPVEVVDGVSGAPAVQYLLKVETDGAKIFSN